MTATAFYWIVRITLGAVPSVELIDDYGTGTLAECKSYVAQHYTADHLCLNIEQE